MSTKVRPPIALTLSTLALVSVAACAAQAQPARNGPSAVQAGAHARSVRDADEATLRALPLVGADAWNRGDDVGVAAMFEENADLVSGDGLHTRGRADITRYFARLMGVLAPGTRYVVRVDHVRFITSDVAIVHSYGGFLRPGETELAPDRRGVQTLVARKEGNVWLGASLQVTRIVPTPPR